MHCLLLSGFAKLLSLVIRKMPKAAMKSWQLAYTGVVFQRFCADRVEVLRKSLCNHLESYSKCEKTGSQHICLKLHIFLCASGLYCSDLIFLL